MRRLAAAVLAPCMLAACGGGGADGDAQATKAVEGPGATTNEGSPEGSMPVHPIPRPEQAIAAGTLSSVNNSGVGAP
ncbi:MAG TPA: hypothetical protein VF142_01205 [Longimicrobium sp.]